MTLFPKFESEKFTPEQCEEINQYVEKFIWWFVGMIDNWMESEVLPVTINPDEEQYGIADGSPIIHREKLVRK